MKFFSLKNPTFAYDYRGLASFRFLMGTLAIIDLLVRFQDISTHYSDQGLLPRTLLLSEILHPWSFSVYLLNGTEVFVALLLTFHLLVAVGFTLGFKTKLNSFLLCFLTISIHDRCPFINNAGDDIFRLFSLIGIFLPLGRVWSLDSYLKPERLNKKTYVSWWTFSYSLQLGLIYFISVFHKTDPIWRKDFTAVYYALSLDLFATDFGHKLLYYPELLKLLTIGTLIVEFIGPLFLFIPWRSHYFRFLACLMFIILHSSFILCMDLGLFAYICLAVWIGALPSFVWDYVERKFRHFACCSLNTFPAPEKENKVSFGFYFGQFFALIYIATTFSWNLETVPWSGVRNPEWMKGISRVLHTYQEWNMFAPFPKKNDGWFVIPAIFTDGSEQDLFSGRKDITLMRPKNVPGSFKNEKWRKFFTNLIDNQKHREYYAQFLCKSYNELAPNAKKQLKSFKIIYMEEVTEVGDPDPPEQMMILWQQFCFAKDREEFLENAEKELPP